MRLLTLILAGLLLPALSAASGVNLGVGADVEAAIAITERGKGTWTVEAENPGSIPIHGRFLLAVTRGGETTFTAWSDTITLQPGEAASRVLSTPPSVNGTGTLTFQYGAYRTPSRTVDVLSREDPSADGRNASGLAIPAVRAYPERVRVMVAAPVGEEVFVTVHDGSTRIFAQRHVTVSGGVEAVDVPVHPRLASDATLHVTVHTRDGGAATTVVRSVPVLTGVERVLWTFLERLGVAHVFT